MRSVSLIAMTAFALSLATAASAAPNLDAAGKCRDNGKFVSASMCTAPTAGKCRDAKTKKFAKCGAPGAEAAPAKK